MFQWLVRRALTTSVAVVLLAVVPSFSSALESIDRVTPARAQELGLEIRSNAAGPDAVRVELEFETSGKLKGYSRVAFEMRDGDKLLATSTLREEESKPGRVIVSFAADRAQLDKLTLKVVTMDGGTRVGHILAMKDFVDLEKIR